MQYSKPYVANIIVLIAPQDHRSRPTPIWASCQAFAVPRGSAQDTQVTKNAPRAPTSCASMATPRPSRRMVSGQVKAVGGNMFYMRALNAGAARHLRGQARVPRILQRRLHAAWREGNQRVDQHLHRQDQGQWRAREDLQEVDEARPAGQFPGQHRRRPLRRQLEHISKS